MNEARSFTVHRERGKVVLVIDAPTTVIIDFVAEKADELGRSLIAAAAYIAAGKRLAALTAEPKCPDCGCEVLRPKCFFEAGPDCPRHDVITAHGGHARLRERLKELGIEP